MRRLHFATLSLIALVSLEANAKQVTFNAYRWLMKDNIAFGTQLAGTLTVPMTFGGDRYFGEVKWDDSDGVVQVLATIAIEGLNDPKCNNNLNYHLSIQQKMIQKSTGQQVSYSESNSTFCETNSMDTTSMSIAAPSGGAYYSTFHLYK